MGDVINIDSRGYTEELLYARVVADGRGRPCLEPMPGTTSRWGAVLARHLDRGAIRLVVSRIAQRRSGRQNRYLWGGVYDDILKGMKKAAGEMGCEAPFASDDDVHEWAKWKFLRVTRVFPGGEEEECARSTTRLTVEEFGDYIEKIAVWGAERGIYVHRPEEWYQLNEGAA
jgi:hypothetical protein